MNTRSLLRILGALAILGSLGGCASMSKNECLAANWEDVGIRDGADGRPEEYLIQHSKACAKVNIVPDRGAWSHGREQGLDRFCVPYRAYQLGENGYGFDVAICRNYDQDRLFSAYEKGRDVNRLGGQLAPSTARSPASTTASMTRTWRRRSGSRSASASGNSPTSEMTRNVPSKTLAYVRATCNPHG